MKPHSFGLAMVLLASLACVPPVVLFLPDQPKPFHAASEGDLGAAGRVAAESRRTLKVGGPVAVSKVMDALLDMGCTVTASDASTRFITFERIRKEPAEPRTHKGMGYDSAVEIGTLKLAADPAGGNCTLVLTGKIHWRTVHHGIATEVIPRLSPDDHKRFLDELVARGI